jgi:hypothetical protein
MLRGDPSMLLTKLEKPVFFLVSLGPGPLLLPSSEYRFDMTVPSDGLVVDDGSIGRKLVLKLADCLKSGLASGLVLL